MVSIPENPNLVEKMWLRYRSDWLPSDASDERVRDCRKCFYAGIHSMSELLDAAGQVHSEDEMASILTTVAEEIAVHRRDVAEGRA